MLINNQVNPQINIQSKSLIKFPGLSSSMLSSSFYSSKSSPIGVLGLISSLEKKPCSILIRFLKLGLPLGGV